MINNTNPVINNNCVVVMPLEIIFRLAAASAVLTIKQEHSLGLSVLFCLVKSQVWVCEELPASFLTMTHGKRVLDS